MNKSPTFLPILSRWPSRRELASDLGISIKAVHHWFERDSVPAKYDAALLDAASARNLPLNWRELMDARSVQRDQHGDTAAPDQGRGQ